MVKEQLSRFERLERKSARELSVRSIGLEKSISTLHSFPEKMFSEEFGKAHPNFDVADPAHKDFVENTIKVGQINAKIETTTIPKLQELKAETDTILEDKIKQNEKARIDALSLSSGQKNALKAHVLSEIGLLQDLIDSGHITSPLALRVAEARIQAIDEYVAPRTTARIKEPTKKTLEKEKNENTKSLVELPNGVKVEVEGNMYTLLNALLAKRYDRSEIASEIFGESNPDTIDLVDMWISKLSMDILAKHGLEILEVSINAERVIMAIVFEATRDEEYAQLTKSLKESTKKSNKTTSNQTVNPKEYSSEIADERLKVFELLFSGQEVTRDLILQNIGEMTNGRKYSWPSALMALGTSRAKLYSHVNRGTASEREQRISDAMIRVAPKGLTRFEASKHIGRVLKSILKDNETVRFEIPTSPEKTIANETNTPINPVDIEQLPEEIVSTEELIGEAVEPTIITTPEVEIEKPNLTAVALALAQSIHELPEDLEETRKKLAETGSLGKNSPVDELRKFHDILNDEAKAAEYILSFDDEDALSLLYYLEENKEIIHDLLPSKEEDEEFEIGPNGQLIIKGQGQERTKLSNIETRIPDIRTLARTKISDVEARIPYADANFFQITGAFQGLGMKDIHAAVNEGLVKPHKASEGREAFYKHEVAMILARKDLRKFSLTKNMKKEMSEIFEDELRKFEDELKKKD